MKKVRQYVAMASAALMITSVIPANITYADEVIDSAVESTIVTEKTNSEAEAVTENVNSEVEETTEDKSNEVEQPLENIDLTEDSISEINAGECSVEVTNFNANSAYVQLNNLQGGFNHIVMSYVAKNDSQDGGTKLLNGSSGGIIEGLRSNTEYEIKAYGIKVSAGSKGGATSTSTYLGSTTFKTTPGDFLVIVGESLYEDSGLKSSLKTYTDDIRKEGINAELIRVSKTEGNEDGSDGVYNCSDSVKLKEIIQDRYNNGAKGFVIIGSNPDIPTVFAESCENIDETFPTDLYYADMDEEWLDADNDGFYEQGSAYNQYYEYKPEMYYGRISAAGIASETYTTEAQYIKSYLDRIHNYRINGGNLESDAQNRGLSFVDSEDFRGKKNNIYPLASVVSNIKAVYDEDETCKSNWVKELKTGYALVHLTSHSSPERNTFSLINNHKNGEWVITVTNVLNNNNIIPKFNFLDLSACSACCYEKFDSGVQANMGEAYLYKDTSLGLNVSGASYTCRGTIIDKDEEFYSNLANKIPVGIAYKNALIKNLGQNTLFSVLLGDPTIKYNLKKPDTATPYLTDNFAGSGNNIKSIKTGQDFNISLYWVNRDVNLDFYIDEKKVDIYKKGVQAYLRPELSLADGNPHKARVELYNTDTNGNITTSYSETFSFNVEQGVEKTKYIATHYLTMSNGGSNVMDFSLGDYVKVFEEPSIDNSMTYEAVYAENPGTYKIKLSYLKGAGQSAQVSVDGSNELPQNVTFDAGATEKEVTLYLQKGYNNITIKAASNAGLPTMYKLEIVQ